MAKMKFSEDKFVNGECVYSAGKVYEVPVGSVDRWLKRGGVIVGEEQIKLDSEEENVDTEETLDLEQDLDIDDLDDLGDDKVKQKTSTKKKKSSKK